MSQVTFETLSARLNAIKASERITKEELSALSRESLTFLLETGDVRIINMLLGQDENGKFILTPINRKTANLFFKEFVGFTVQDGDSSVVEFVKKKVRVWEKYVEKVNTFLSVPHNDIWTWAAENVEIEKKAPIYADKINTLVAKALKDEVNGISQVDILKAVLSGGVSVDSLFDLVTELTEQAKAA